MKTDLELYKKLRVDSESNLRTPIAYYPNPSKEDYNKGYIERYFIQKRDTKGAPIFEVKRTTFVQYYKTPFYTGVNLKWRIIGDLVDRYDDNGAFIPSVITSNSKSIAEAEKVMDDINLYLVNLKQFHKVG
jgi:hypothetical protein